MRATALAASKAFRDRHPRTRAPTRGRFLAACRRPARTNRDRARLRNAGLQKTNLDPVVALFNFGENIFGDLLGRTVHVEINRLHHHLQRLLEALEKPGNRHA